MLDADGGDACRGDGHLGCRHGDGVAALRWIVGRKPVYVYKVFAIVSVSVLVFCLVGMVYPVRKMRRVYRRSFAGQSLSGRSHAWLLVVQCFACAFLLFLSLGMQRQLSRDDKFRFGFRPSKHPQALHRVEGHAGDGCDLQLPGHL